MHQILVSKNVSINMLLLNCCYGKSLHQNVVNKIVCPKMLLVKSVPKYLLSNNDIGSDLVRFFRDKMDFFSVDFNDINHDDNS